VLIIRHIAKPFPLGASVGRPTTQQQTDRNEERKCQRFAKLKEVFCQRTSRHKTPHLILPNRTQIPPSPPDNVILNQNVNNYLDNLIE
jgi:hypothetical protein